MPAKMNASVVAAKTIESALDTYCSARPHPSMVYMGSLPVMNAGVCCFGTRALPGLEAESGPSHRCRLRALLSRTGAGRDRAHVSAGAIEHHPLAVHSMPP